MNAGSLRPKNPSTGCVAQLPSLKGPWDDSHPKSIHWASCLSTLLKSAPASSIIRLNEYIIAVNTKQLRDVLWILSMQNKPFALQIIIKDFCFQKTTEINVPQSIYSYFFFRIQQWQLSTLRLMDEYAPFGQPSTT